MKTLQKISLNYVEVQHIPDPMEPGVFYHSQAYETSSHLCVCGCGRQTPLPIRPGEWSVVVDKGTFSVSPSILQRGGCQSHYIITNGVANLV
jgi:hypothetical protein